GLADQRRGQCLAVALAAEDHAGQQQRGQQAEHDQWQPAGLGWVGGHCTLPAVLAVPGRASTRRKRRSAAVTSPPSVISNAPTQIQRTNGLMCTRMAHASPPSGSPSATYRSRVTLRSMAASVMTWPPLT